MSFQNVLCALNIFKLVYLESLFVNHKILSAHTTKIHQFLYQNLNYRRKYVHLRISNCLYYNEPQQVLCDCTTLWNWLIDISALKISRLSFINLLIFKIYLRFFDITKNIVFYTGFYKKVKKWWNVHLRSSGINPSICDSN